MWSWAEPLAHYWQPARAWKWNKKFLCLLYFLSLQNNCGFGLFALHYNFFHCTTNFFHFINGVIHSIYEPPCWPLDDICIIPVVKFLLGCTKGAVVRFGRAGGVRERLVLYSLINCTMQVRQSAIIAQYQHQNLLNEHNCWGPFNEQKRENMRTTLAKQVAWESSALETTLVIYSLMNCTLQVRKILISSSAQPILNSSTWA